MHGIIRNSNKLKRLGAFILENTFEILIVEDDETLAAGLCRALLSQGLKAESCGLLKSARAKIPQKNYALLILDVNLPDGDGFDFLCEAKQMCNARIIMLTANDLEMDIVAGLEAGADDYITKPFSLAVLRARVNTQLRNWNIETSGNEKTQEPSNAEKRELTTVKIDAYVFDFVKMQFSYKDTLIELSKTEQKLLWCLVNNRGVTLSRSFLIDFIWTDGAEYVDENALSVSIKRLRDKLSAQQYIKTIYGIGYTWKG